MTLRTLPRHARLASSHACGNLSGFMKYLVVILFIPQTLGWLFQPAFGKGDWFDRKNSMQIGRGRGPMETTYECRGLSQSQTHMDGLGIWNYPEDTATILGIALYADSICNNGLLAVVVLDSAILRGFHVANFKTLRDFDFIHPALIKSKQVKSLQGIRVSKELVGDEILRGIPAADLPGAIIWYDKDGNRRVQKNAVQWVNLIPYEKVWNSKHYPLMREVVERAVNPPYDPRSHNSAYLIADINRNVGIPGNQLFAPTMGGYFPYQNLRLPLRDSYYQFETQADTESRENNDELAKITNEQEIQRYFKQNINQILINSNTEYLDPPNPAEEARFQAARANAGFEQLLSDPLFEAPVEETQMIPNFPPANQIGTQPYAQSEQPEVPNQNWFQRIHEAQTQGETAPMIEQLIRPSYPNVGYMASGINPETIANAPVPMDLMRLSIESFPNREQWLRYMHAHYMYSLKVFNTAKLLFGRYEQQARNSAEAQNLGVNEQMIAPSGLEVEEFFAQNPVAQNPVAQNPRANEQIIDPSEVEVEDFFNFDSQQRPESQSNSQGENFAVPRRGGINEGTEPNFNELDFLLSASPDLMTNFQQRAGDFFGSLGVERNKVLNRGRTLESPSDQQFAGFDTLATPPSVPEGIGTTGDIGSRIPGEDTDLDDLAGSRGRKKFKPSTQTRPTDPN